MLLGQREYFPCCCYRTKAAIVAGTLMGVTVLKTVYSQRQAAVAGGIDPAREEELEKIRPKPESDVAGTWLD